MRFLMRSALTSALVVFLSASGAFGANAAAVAEPRLDENSHVLPAILISSSHRLVARRPRIFVISPRRAGSMTLGYRRGHPIWKSWRRGGPFDVVEPLYLSIAVVGDYGATGTLHVTIRGLDCANACTNQSNSLHIQPLPRSSHRHLGLVTKPWGCGKPTIRAWTTSRGGRSPTQVWRPLTGCAE
jgi:hypothetical protein